MTTNSAAFPCEVTEHVRVTWGRVASGDVRRTRLRWNARKIYPQGAGSSMGWNPRRPLKRDSQERHHTAEAPDSGSPV